MAMNVTIEPIVGEVQPVDPLIRAGIVEYALKSAFTNAFQHINTPKRHISSDMNDKFVSFMVFFEKDEIFLRELFCGHLYSNGVKFSKDEKGISFKAEKNVASFLNAVFLAVKDFKNQMLAMEKHQGPTHKTGMTSSSAFFKSHQEDEIEVHLSVQAGSGKS